ncbi:MAG TPA: hypothetical protein VMB03_32980 [Bryobacteraceae bacterium]|nr:hypothetical protein [Bryobacteraceae bacterium]
MRETTPGTTPVLLTSLALLLTAGCGYLGQPMVPLANVPQRITDLAAVQRGAFLVARCTIPTFTTENNPIKASVKLDLRIGVAGNPFVPADWSTQAKPYSQFEGKDGIATFQIPAGEWTGKQVTIGIRSIAVNGKHSDWSNFETLPVVSPPAAPSAPTIEDIAAGERITWTGAGDRFRVFRKAGDENDYTVVATVTGHEWTDTGIEYGKSYTYKLQALVDAAHDKVAESDLSAAASRTPKDTFPPAVPAGLRADRSGNGVSLVWEPDNDADLAGYRVYRSEGNGAWQKLADTNTVPTYSDTTAEHGKAYHYAVSAFDKTGNESRRCAPVEIQFP